MWDKCYMYQTFDQGGKNYSNPFAMAYIQSQGVQQIVPCDHFEHSAEYVSLVTQFNLVCSRELLVSVTQVCHALGGLIGGLMALHVLKQYVLVSPKRLMLCGMIGQMVCGNLTGLVSTYTLHIYFRWLTAVFCAFMTTAGQIISNFRNISNVEQKGSSGWASGSTTELTNYNKYHLSARQSAI